MDKTAQQVGGKFLLLPVLIFFAVFFLFPVTTIVRDAFSSESGGPTLAHLRGVISSRYYLRILGFTAFQATISALFSVLLGLPGAFILSHYSFPGKRVLRSLTTIPFVMPAILVVLGFIILFGNNGVINRTLMKVLHLEGPPLKILYSFPAIILAHVFYNFPIAMRLIASSWEHISYKNIESARTLGAGPFRRFRTITLPRLLPGVMASCILIFLFCFLSFAVILVLGGGPRFTTTEVEVYRLARFSLDFSAAGALSIVQAIVTFAILFGYTKIQNRLAAEERNPEGMSLKPLRSIGGGSGPGLLIGLIIYGIIIFVVIILPLLTIVLRSFQNVEGWDRNIHYTLTWYKTLFSKDTISAASVSASAVINSLIIAIGSTAVSLSLGLISALWLRNHRGKFGGFIQMLFLLPMGISTILLGLGYIRVLNLTALPRAYLIITIFAHAVISFPFVFRSLQPSVSSINTHLREAAGTLGAGEGRIFRTIEAPLLRSAIISAGVFAFAISIGEINTTLVLAPEGFSTIPVAVYRLISSYNFFGACALGTILLLLCGGAFYIVDFILPKGKI